MTIGAVLFVVFLIAGIALIGAGRKRPGEALPGRDTQSRSRVGGVVEGGFGFLFVFLGLILILFGMYLGSCSLQPGAVLLLGFAVVFVIAGVAVMRVGLRMCSFGGKREVDP
ncbi:MAG: hypothetical protein OEZ03_16585 [Alphaproteobacteria bacterium]|nr:hypothetical protein [Alphaproteobacteria bacterium]